MYLKQNPVNHLGSKVFPLPKTNVKLYTSSTYIYTHSQQWLNSFGIHVQTWNNSTGLSTSTWLYNPPQVCLQYSIKMFQLNFNFTPHCYDLNHARASVDVYNTMRIFRAKSIGQTLRRYNKGAFFCPPDVGSKSMVRWHRSCYCSYYVLNIRVLFETF